MSTDPVATADDILDGTICECGHTEGEHVFSGNDNDPDACRPAYGEACDCALFRPVEFVVTRA